MINNNIDGLDERVARIISDGLVFNGPLFAKAVGSITPETRLIEDLNADSLDFVEIALILELEFKIKIEDEIETSWKTVADVQKTVRDAIAKPQPVTPGMGQ